MWLTDQPPSSGPGGGQYCPRYCDSTTTSSLLSARRGDTRNNNNPLTFTKKRVILPWKHDNRLRGPVYFLLLQFLIFGLVPLREEEAVTGGETIMWTCVNYGCLLWRGKYETWIRPQRIVRLVLEFWAKHHHLVIMMGERRITLRVETRSADTSPSRSQQCDPGHRSLSSKILQTRTGGKDDIVLRWGGILKWATSLFSHQFLYGLYFNCSYKTLQSYRNK